jgi:hypothetical protein
MPITLGILAQSRQVVDTGAFQLLESTVLTGSQAFIEFTNLTTKYASTYQHLQIRMVARGTTATANTSIRINGSSSSIYSIHRLIAEYTGGTLGLTSQAQTSQDRMNFVATQGRSSSAANAFGASVIDLLDPFETGKNTVVRTLGGQLETNDSVVAVYSGMWNDTASVTSIRLFPGSGDYAQHSRFSLYGIKAVA